MDPDELGWEFGTISATGSSANADDHLRSWTTAILPSIWMSMEMKHREYGNDIISGGEEDPVRKAPQ